MMKSIADQICALRTDYEDVSARGKSIYPTEIDSMQIEMTLDGSVDVTISYTPNDGYAKDPVYMRFTPSQAQRLFHGLDRIYIVQLPHA
jgi:hypothetical protein